MHADPLPPRLIEASSTARLLKVDVGTLYRLVREGRAPVEPVRVGRALRWRVSDLAAFFGCSPDDVLRDVEQLRRLRALVR